MKVSNRLEPLFMAACMKAPEIPREYGRHSKVSEEEAMAIRNLYKELKLEELVALELNIELDIVDKVVQGEIWPYAGGPLKKHESAGLNTANCYSSNQSRFLRGVIALAAQYLTGDELEILANMSGEEVKKFKTIADRVEARNDASRFVRARKMLLHVSQGRTTEEAAKLV